MLSKSASIWFRPNIQFKAKYFPSIIYQDTGDVRNSTKIPRNISNLTVIIIEKVKQPRNLKTLVETSNKKSKISLQLLKGF